MQSPDGTRRRLVRIAGGAFACATAIAVFTIIVDRASGGTASVLLGPLDEQTILSGAMLVAFVAIVVGLWGVGGPRRMLPFTIVGILAATVAALTAGFFSLVSVDVSLTTVVEDGCDSGYVVVERQLLLGSSGTIYRKDGPLVSTIAGRVSGNNAHQPFAAGDYTATRNGSTLLVRYRPNPGGTAVQLFVPAVVDRESACGLTDPDPGGRPQPSASAAPPLTPSAMDDEIRRLVDASLSASTGAAVDAGGAPIDPSTVTPVRAPCTHGSGVQLQVDLAFRTDDNAASVVRILEVWDDAGYSADRSMQEDIRYSASNAVARMSIRDKTSVDGLVHLTIVSACTLEN